MSQVKSSSHSPHCLDHSPYPPCVPTCRLARPVDRTQPAVHIPTTRVRLPKAALISNDLPAALDKRPPTPRPASTLATTAILAAGPALAFIGGLIAGYATR